MDSELIGLIGQIIAFVGTIITTFATRRQIVRKEGERINKIRKKQLDRIYGPLWKLQMEEKCYDKNRWNNKYVSCLAKIYKDYYMYLDISIIDFYLEYRKNSEEGCLEKIKKIVNANYERLIIYFKYPIGEISTLEGAKQILWIEVVCASLIYVAVIAKHFFSVHTKILDNVVIVLAAICFGCAGYCIISYIKEKQKH